MNTTFDPLSAFVMTLIAFVTDFLRQLLAAFLF